MAEGSGTGIPTAPAEAGAAADIVATMTFTGACDADAGEESTAGAVARSCPGSLRQQEVALRTRPVEGGADTHVPQLCPDAGIFMPQLMAAARQGTAPARTNARRTNVDTVRFMDLSCGTYVLYPATTVDAPSGPRDSGLPLDIGRRASLLEGGCPNPGPASRYSMVARGKDPAATGGAGTTSCP